MIDTSCSLSSLKKNKKVQFWNLGVELYTWSVLKVWCCIYLGCLESMILHIPGVSWRYDTAYTWGVLKVWALSCKYLRCLECMSIELHIPGVSWRYECWTLYTRGFLKVWVFEPYIPWRGMSIKLHIPEVSLRYGCWAAYTWGVLKA